MRKAGRWIPILALAPCLLAGGLAGGGDANLLYGRKALDEDQSEVGLSVTLDFD